MSKIPSLLQSWHSHTPDPGEGQQPALGQCAETCPDSKHQRRSPSADPVALTERTDTSEGFLFVASLKKLGIIELSSPWAHGLLIHQVNSL